MAMKTFWFDGRSAAEFGISISGSETFNAAERDVETVSIPGRNGDLIVDKGRYKNVPVSYPASICDDFAANAEAARAWLGSRVGYCRLEDDYDPEHFRLARFQGPLSFTPGFLNKTAEATIRFDCKPQRFLKSGDEPIPLELNGVTTVSNFTAFPAKPLIKVKCSEDFTVTIDKTTVQPAGIGVHKVDGHNSYIIDTESMLVYPPGVGDVYPDTYIKGTLVDGLALLPGGNFVEVRCRVEGALQEAQIIPRWWTL